jgi:hypothetical protein
MLRRLSTKFLGLLARAADVPATRVDRVAYTSSSGFFTTNEFA